MLTCVANSGIIDLNSHLVCLGRRNFNILDAQVLASFPSHGRLASDCLHARQGESQHIFSPGSARLATFHELCAAISSRGVWKNVDKRLHLSSCGRHDELCCWVRAFRTWSKRVVEIRSNDKQRSSSQGPFR